MAMALSASDLPAIYTMLSNSLSGDESLRKPAEAALSQFESRPGFCSCLMEVITAKDLASQTHIRLLATVYFKNNISRYWRNRRDSSGISNEEKVHLRQKLLSHLREENHQIATMLAVLISKIARIDYPKEWPELFSILAQQFRSADILTSHRIFIILFRTLKELSTKRLTSDQRTFAEMISQECSVSPYIFLAACGLGGPHVAGISSQFFDYTWHLWQSDVQTILHGFSALAQSFSSNMSVQQQDELYLTCERWLFCLKILRQLIISGFPSDAKCLQEVRPVKEVSPMLLQAIQSFIPYYSSLQERHTKFWDFMRKACIKLMKVLIAIQRRHPYSFGDKCVLLPVMDFCLNKITDPEPNVILFEQFLIQCMVMVKCVLECKEYKPSLTGRVIDANGITIEQMKKDISGFVVGVLASLLPNERVVLLCNILIRRYFVLTASDLEEWYQNPEQFHHEQDMIQWTEKLRPCAEALYIVLFETHSQLLGPVVVSILQEAMNGCPASVTEITPGMLLKDAAYGAAAYVYYELSNYLSFKDWKVALLLGQWVSEALLQSAASNRGTAGPQHSGHNVTQYGELNNIVEDGNFTSEGLMGTWASYIKDDTKRTVYYALIRLLQDKDLAVRLAACRSLVFHIEDANFSEQNFADLLPICWDLCFKLVEEVQEFDSKVQVLNLISSIITHVPGVIPFADKLVQFFQKIWDESSGESLLQIQLLNALRNFVAALGQQSPICYNMLLPILQRGIDINSPDELNLLEDSMLLWEATLTHAPSMVPQLLECFPCLLEILERSFDHLQVAVNIIESYVILGGNAFLSAHASTLAKILDLIVGNVNDRGLQSTLPVIDILLQFREKKRLKTVFPRGGAAIDQQYSSGAKLLAVYFLKLIVMCLSGGDDSVPSKTAVKASIAAILARILIMNTNYLAQLTSEPSLMPLLQNVGFPTEENVLLCLVDIWLEKVDHVTSIQRKTIGLALSIILTLRVPQVLEKLDQILSVCTSVLMGGNDDFSEEESSGDNINSIGSHHEGTIPTKELRKRQIKQSDPINQMSLEASVKENLQTCGALHGESFNSAIGRMHPAAFAQLKQALKMS
ncbi:Importin-beta, N-terminal domain [Dillenia turbinata]|uniref:Importin-beta, N-terminal domain n=1 Tax=Dillenia turbinata TaxID=194707 RepID=A0AAN8W871_9MAGN